MPQLKRNVSVSLVTRLSNSDNSQWSNFSIPTFIRNTLNIFSLKQLSQKARNIMKLSWFSFLHYNYRLNQI